MELAGLLGLLAAGMLGVVVWAALTARAEEMRMLRSRLDLLEEQVANGLQAAGQASLQNTTAINHTIAAVEMLMVGLRALKEEADESYLRKSELN